jgi:hypothetical protein
MQTSKPKAKKESTLTLKVTIPPVQDIPLKKMKEINDERGRTFYIWNLKNWKALGFKSEKAFEKVSKEHYTKANLCPPEAWDIYDLAVQEISKRRYSSSIIIYKTAEGKFEFNSCPCSAEGSITQIIEKCGGQWYGIIMSWVI